MRGKPAYTKTYLSDKALVLLSHLSNTLITVGPKSNKEDYGLCRELIMKSEGRLSKGENKEDNQTKVEDGGDLLEKELYDKKQNCKQVIMNSLRETFEALKNSNY